MLLSLRASQLLIDLFQRFSLHDDPLKEVGKIFKAADVYQNCMKSKTAFNSSKAPTPLSP